ncbi:MAG: TIGR02300 family protein [Alphaproteobacteria bacterium GWF2_58_20]|nr:MAG: TIGR02300 family protein [Alphaproteobacteria bacterium GWF2_58_20]
MAKPEWGIKRICPHCEIRYYDLGKNPPVCPSCKGVYDAELMLKSRKSRSTGSEDAMAAEVAKETPEDLLLVDEADADPIEAGSSDLLEDTSELDSGESEIEVKLEEE